VAAVNQNVRNQEALAAVRKVLLNDEAGAGAIAGKDSEVGKFSQQRGIDRVLRHLVFGEELVVVYIDHVGRAVDEQAVLIFIGREREECKGDVSTRPEFLKSRMKPLS
jgi:hypothetical protein